MSNSIEFYDVKSKNEYVQILFGFILILNV